MQEQQPGSVPQITIMRRLHKRCDGRYNGGGRSENQAYRRWIKEFAAGIGSRRVVIAYEPDSTGSLECDSRSQQRVRMYNYKYAVDILSKLPNATVYLEAGASDWRPAHVIARRLRRIGIHKVRGFMVNVTHHDWTRNNIRFCKQLSKMLRGKHCVISTTDNGNGPLRFKRWRDRKRNIWYWENIWCNPPNGAAGTPPRVAPLGRSHVVDAYFWIGRPATPAASATAGRRRARACSGRSSRSAWPAARSGSRRLAGLSVVRRARRLLTGARQANARRAVALGAIAQAVELYHRPGALELARLVVEGLVEVEGDRVLAPPVGAEAGEPVGLAFEPL